MVTRKRRSSIGKRRGHGTVLCQVSRERSVHVREMQRNLRPVHRSSDDNLYNGSKQPFQVRLKSSGPNFRSNSDQ